MPDIQGRFCMINQKGGPVSVVLNANNALRAGADFLFSDQNGAQKGNWKMGAGNSGSANQPLPAPVANKDVLNWQILCCSLHPNVDAGIVEIQIMQDGVSCQMTKPAQWNLQNVPQCRTGQAIPINANLTFLLV
jgi:hypothetical protein